MSTILVIPDEVLEKISLLLDDAADVIRASAACTTQPPRRSNRGFLRRYRLLHPPPVLGFLESMGTGGFHQAEAPHRSAPAAASLAQAADFTFSFLPTPDPANPWRICDARDGRVLLSRRGAGTFLELVVCDPLHRRHVAIPAIPEDLFPRRYSAEMESEPFLLPARVEEDESRFRVIYNWVCRYRIISFTFDSGSGSSSTTTENPKWSLAANFSFLLRETQIPDNPMRWVRHRHYVGSCFYWVNSHVPNHMLVLDPAAMKFSVAGLPAGRWGELAVVDAGVDRLGMAVLPARNLVLYSRTWQNNGGRSAEGWQRDRHHQLPEGYPWYYICGAAEGYLLLAGWHLDIETVPYFLLDLKTLQVERFCKSVDPVRRALPYARFRPSILSPPSI